MTKEQVSADREEVRVVFRRTTDAQEAITRTWAEVEAAAGTLQGRTFFGAFDPATREYRGAIA